ARSRARDPLPSAGSARDLGHRLQRRCRFSRQGFHHSAQAVSARRAQPRGRACDGAGLARPAEQSDRPAQRPPRAQARTLATVRRRGSFRRRVRPRQMLGQLAAPRIILCFTAVGGARRLVREAFRELVDVRTRWRIIRAVAIRRSILGHAALLSIYKRNRVAIRAVPSVEWTGKEKAPWIPPKGRCSAASLWPRRSA